MRDDQWRRLLSDLHGQNDNRALEAANRLTRLTDASRLNELKSLLRESTDPFILASVAAPVSSIDGLKSLDLLLEALDKCLQQGDDADGLAFAITEVVTEEAKAAAPVLRKMLREKSPTRRAHAAWLLGFTAETIEPDCLLEALLDGDARVRAAATASLSSYPDHGVFDAVAGMLADPDERVRVDAASTLGNLGDERAIPLLEKAKRDSSEVVRDFAAYSLEALEDELS